MGAAADLWKGHGCVYETNKFEAYEFETNKVKTNEFETDKVETKNYAVCCFEKYFPLEFFIMLPDSFFAIDYFLVFRGQCHYEVRIFFFPKRMESGCLHIFV